LAGEKIKTVRAQLCAESFKAVSNNAPVNSFVKVEKVTRPAKNSFFELFFELLERFSNKCRTNPEQVKSVS
jgi:hypothetical protein